MKHYIVITHMGEYSTYAVSAKKALNNVRWRIYGRSVRADSMKLAYWKVTEVA